MNDVVRVRKTGIVVPGRHSAEVPGFGTMSFFDGERRLRRETAEAMEAAGLVTILVEESSPSRWDEV